MSTRFRTRVLRPLTNQNGLSLAELLVAMMIVSMVLVVMAVMTNSTLSQQRLASAKTVSQADSRLAMEVLSRELRVALVQQPQVTGGSNSAFFSASPRKLSFVTGRGPSTATTSPRPELVTYEVSSDARACLLRTARPGVQVSGRWQYPTSGGTTACVVPGRVTTTGALFTFYGEAVTGGPDAAMPTSLSVPASGWVATSVAQSAQLAEIRTVEVSLTMQDPTRPDVAGTTVQQVVTVFNQLDL